MEEQPRTAAAAVGERLREIRERKGWYQQDLANRLAAVGYPMNRVTVAKVEAGKRAVSVGDLLAFATVLNVSPNRLLLPDVAGDETVWVTPTLAVPAWAVWAWAEGQGPLPTLSEGDGLNTEEEFEQYLQERPAPLRRREQHPAVRAAIQLLFRVGRLVQNAKDGTGFATRLTATRRALDRVAAELDELEEGSA